MKESGTATDRRSEARVAHQAVVILAFGQYEKMDFEHAAMLDCSPRGIRLEMERPVEVGSSFLLKPRRGSAIMLAYTVRNCTRLRQAYEVGAEYTGFVGPGGVTLTPEGVLEMLLGT